MFRWPGCFSSHNLLKKTISEEYLQCALSSFSQISRGARPARKIQCDKCKPITKRSLERFLLSVPYPYCKASGAQLALLVIILKKKWIKSYLLLIAGIEFHSTLLRRNLQQHGLKQHWSIFSDSSAERVPSQFSQLTSCVCQKTVVKKCSSRHATMSNKNTTSTCHFLPSEVSVTKITTWKKWG